MCNTREYYAYTCIDGRIVILDMFFAFNAEDAVMLAIDSFPSVDYRNIFALPYPHKEAA